MKTRGIIMLCVALILGSIIIIHYGCNKNGDEPDNTNSDELTEQEISDIVESYKKISITADSILSSENPIEGFKQYIELYKTEKMVEAVWVTEMELFVSFKKGGVTFWYIAPEPCTDISKISGNINKNIKINDCTPIGTELVCLINQTSNDENRTINKEKINELYEKLELNGFNPITIDANNFTMNFFKGQIANYGAILLVSHGSYCNEEDLTLIFTGEEIEDIDEFIKNNEKDWKEHRLGIGEVTEIRNGKKVEIIYACITQKFIDHYTPIGFPNSLIYLTTCQSFKDLDTNLQQILRKKGAGVTIGWSDLDCTDPDTWEWLFNRLLEGGNIEQAYEEMPNFLKEKDCEYPPPGSGIFEHSSLKYTKNDGDMGLKCCDSYFTDTRDGQTYCIVDIGNQTWFAENLNYATGNSWCYDNNYANCETYGRLYDWETAMGVCPSGWHLPSDAEWCVLENEVDAGTVSCTEEGWRGIDAGLNLKSTSGWYSSGNGTDLFGFTALPGGYRNSGYFECLGNSGHFWTSTESSYYCARDRRLRNGYDGVYRYYTLKNYGYYSVRCLKD
ncbi:MAG: fibrobacter succinogenes major paralogous domain-containing protein [Bacteroidales bacterium]|nr:fibrobacter succinogenes major paralogous domain-containing protein [Bacteroidales bacterium]